MFSNSNDSYIKWTAGDYVLQTFIAIIVIAILAVGKYHFTMTANKFL